MNTVTVAAEKAPQSFAPSEAVSLLVGSTVGEVECALVVQTLACCDGNRTRAARMLGLSVRTLRNKIRLYSAEGIEVPAHTEVPAPPGSKLPGASEGALRPELRSESRQVCRSKLMPKTFFSASSFERPNPTKV